MPSQSPEAEVKNMGVYMAEAVPRERRLWKRFTVNTASVMAVKPPRLIKKRESYLELGPLKNVGMKGLSFYYLEKREKTIASTRALSIAVPGEGILVEKLPFRVVNDFYVARMPGEKETVEKVKTLCVCFKPLLPQQRVQLEQFISEYGDAINLFAITQNGPDNCEGK